MIECLIEVVLQYAVTPSIFASPFGAPLEIVAPLMKHLPF